MMYQVSKGLGCRRQLARTSSLPGMWGIMCVVWTGVELRA
jgi:hypothetical protein